MQQRRVTATCNESYHHALLRIMSQSPTKPMATGQDMAAISQEDGVKLTQHNLPKGTHNDL